MKIQKIEEEDDLYDEEEDDDVSDLLSEDSNSGAVSAQLQEEMKDNVILTPRDIRRFSELSTHKNVLSPENAKESEDTENRGTS